MTQDFQEHSDETLASVIALPEGSWYNMSCVLHDDVTWSFATLAETIAQVEALAEIPFGEGVNKPPCADWRTCAREYAFTVGRDNFTVAVISASGVQWNEQLLALHQAHVGDT